MLGPARITCIEIRESVVAKMSIAGFMSRSRGSRIIFWALLLSMLLHLWLLYLPQIHLVLFPERVSQGIKADLVSTLKVRITEAPPPESVKPQPKPQPRKTAGPALAASPAQSATPEQPVEDAAPTAEEAASAEEVAVAEPKPETAPEQAPSAAEEPVKPVPPMQAKPEPHPPLNLVVEFSLRKGIDGMKVGRVVHTWQISDGRYVISSVMEATGFFALLKRGMFVQSSQGRITPKGLQPDQYWEQRGQEPDRTFHALFDYKKNKLTYGRDGETTTVSFSPGTQDQLSFVYQFALGAPISGTQQFAMTNGRKLGNYTYELVGEEPVATGAGELRTLHVSKVRKEPDDDTVDIWLAVDHQYLPAKVRLTSSDGDVAEQVMEGIKTASSEESSASAP